MGGKDKKYWDRESEREKKKKRGRKNIQQPLVGISHLLVNPRVVHPSREGVGSLDVRGVVECQIDVVDGTAAVGHGDAARGRNREAPDRPNSRDGSRGTAAERERGAGEQHLGTFDRQRIFGCLATSDNPRFVGQRMCNKAGNRGRAEMKYLALVRGKAVDVVLTESRANRHDARPSATMRPTRRGSS